MNLDVSRKNGCVAPFAGLAVSASSLWSVPEDSRRGSCPGQQQLSPLSNFRIFLSNFRIFLSLQKETLYQLIVTLLLQHLTITYLVFVSMYLPIIFACI